MEYFEGFNNEYVHISEVEELEERISCAKDFLEEVLDGLYGKASLEDMENALEEVCSYLGAKMPNGLLNVTKKRHLSNPYFQFGTALSLDQAKTINA